MKITDEAQRQMILLALGQLGARRPGWQQYLGELAEVFHGRETYTEFLGLANQSDPVLAFLAGDKNTENLIRAVERLKQHVDDLQSGMYVNCVYCGHRFGPRETTPATMADALKAHVAECPLHPMSSLVKVCAGSYHAVESLLAVRDGMTDEALATLRNALFAALFDVVPGRVPAPTIGEGNISSHDLENVGEALSGTNFTACLLRLIHKSDATNRNTLRIVYPSVVAAWEKWSGSTQELEGEVC